MTLATKAGTAQRTSDMVMAAVYALFVTLLAVGVLIAAFADS